jgi:histidinol-phosphate/aromatic aminotransferase/cobyric acid decarboxylase-like protein
MREGRLAVADFTPVTRALAEFTARTGQPPIALSGWESDDPAIAPPAELVARLAAIPPRPRRYTYSRDFAVARELAAACIGDGLRFGGAPATAAQVALAPGSSQALLLALLALRARGVRRAVVAAPCYHAIIPMCRQAGLALTLVPARDFLTGALNLPCLAISARRDPAVIIVTNPAYGVGVPYAPEELHALATVLPPTSYLLLDEARMGLHWQHPAPGYQADLPRHTVVIRSPSKVFFLNGLKLSVTLAPAALIRAIERSGETLLGSVAGNFQEVALAYLAAWQSWQDEERDEARQGIAGPYLRWRAGVVAALQHTLACSQASRTGTPFVWSPVTAGPYALLAAPRAALGAIDCRMLARRCGLLAMTSDYCYHHDPAWIGLRCNLAAGAETVVRGVTILASSGG